VQFQFLLARHGVTYSESNALALFEFGALIDLAIKEEKDQIEMMQAMYAASIPRLAGKHR
jgi:hypothetical protein